MNRIWILCFNIVLGLHHIVKVSFTALITVYCFQKFLFCTFSAFDKIKAISCSNCNNPSHMWPPDLFWTGNIFNLKCCINHFHAFFTSPLLLMVIFKTRHRYSPMFAKGSILDVWLDSECVSAVFVIIISL